MDYSYSGARNKGFYLKLSRGTMEKKLFALLLLHLFIEHLAFSTLIVASKVMKNWVFQWGIQNIRG